MGVGKKGTLIPGWPLGWINNWTEDTKNEQHAQVLTGHDHSGHDQCSKRLI